MTYNQVLLKETNDAQYPCKHAIELQNWATVTSQDKDDMDWVSNDDGVL